MPRRRAPQPLTRERVLAAALAAADADGIKGVTMRRLAEDLDCEAMSLYHHIAGKSGLLDALVESVLMEIGAEQQAPGEPTGDWRAIIRHRSLAARRVMQRHPWAPTMFATHPDMPPTMFGFYEQFVGTLVDVGGFDYDLAHRAIHSLGSLVFGFTQELFEPDGGSATEQPSPEEMMEMAKHMPHLLQIAASVPHDSEGMLSTCDTQAEFEFTLDLLLDGLEARRLARASA